MHLLEYLEPAPVFPPSYKTTHTQQASVRYPIYEQEETHKLPGYTPAVYSTTLILRKLEWLSPYEPSPYRSWKPLIMELNSTQLNLYSVDDLPLIGKSANISRIKSRKQLEQFVLFNQAENDLVLEAVKRYPQRYLSEQNLVRSYTLQHAAFGLPVDYKKRNYCLRLRLEAEQFLVQFSSLEMMIDWTNMISTGMNVALDIESRLMPTDRSVPRRRRSGRRNVYSRTNGAGITAPNRLRSYSDSEVIRRQLSPPLGHSPGALSSNRGFIGRIFGRRKSSDATNIQSALESLQLTNEIETEAHQNEANDEDDVSYNDNNIDQELPETDAESDDESMNVMFNNDFSFSDIGDEYEDSDPEYIKWLPDPKQVSQRKLLKDAIRCMRLLPDDETWIGKPIMAPSKPPLFQTCNGVTDFNLNSALKTKNKFIKEFIVGSQGLIAV